MLEAYPALRLIGVDADAVMLERARERLKPFRERAELRNAWFDELLTDYPPDLPRPDRMLFDLGISTYHYNGTGRGFSFRKDEKPDMRLNPELTLSAYEVINGYSQAELQSLFSRYGEEPYSGRIARAVAESRERAPIESTLQLAEIVRSAVPASARYAPLHPATRVFQALRIEVNGELKRLERMLPAAYRVLKPGGLLAVISFHSLEDRQVKQFFALQHRKNRHSVNRYAAAPDEAAPVAECLFKKPVVPSAAEVAENPSSSGARLRVLRKLRETPDE